LKNGLETLESLEQTLQVSQSGIVTIKPKLIFELVEKTFTNIPTITLPVPSSKIGSVTTLEASLISSLLFLKTPKTVFEFGTFLGYTTSILLQNTSPNTKVFSIDLPQIKRTHQGTAEPVDWNLIRSNDAYNDAYLTEQASKSGERYLNSLTGGDRLMLIKLDSRQLIPEKFGLLGNTDFIFLDGGHTDAIVRSDTKKSIEMLSPNGILVWHDYGSKIHSKVTDVVNEYSESNLVIQIKNTMLALTSRDLSFFLISNA
jgi:predicted O-methyltransferase YrrM